VTNSYLRLNTMVMTMPTEAYRKVKVDSCGECIKIDPITGMVRIDGYATFKVRTSITGEIYLQFADDNKFRSSGRGTRFVEVKLDTLIDKIKESCL
jgi:epoxyqueuosine reductase QueG